MKAIYGWLTGIHAFVGLGAMAGGSAAISNPAAPLGISSDSLKLGPFEDFLIPGLVLFIVIGIGNIAAAFIVRKKARYHGVYSGAMGATLMGWIVVQCVILQAVAALHVIFFLIGAVQGLLAFALLFRQNAFPANIARKWLKLN
jgi:hypothetical protein